jgi:hypothetical protein
MEEVPGQGLRRVSHNPRLADTHPEIAAQWHPTLNGSTTPRDVTAIGNYLAWWRCAAGHEWQRQVPRRAFHGSGCPDCTLVTTCLAAVHPALALEWSVKNGGLNPSKVLPSSEVLVWWKCAVDGHDDYQRTVLNRTNKRKPLGCPVCAGVRPERSASFAALFPALAKEWHPKLNEELDPFHFTPGSTTAVWWRCGANRAHEWLAPIFNRTRCPECPYCRLWYVTDENRLSTLFPEIAREWHPTKNRFLWPRIEGSFKAVTNLRLPAHVKERNRRLRPSDVAINCDEVGWWKCSDKGHVWEDRVEARVKGRNCPDCEKDKLVNKKSLAAKFPAVAKLWHPTRNLPVLPTDIVPGATLMAYWRCPKSATHVWQAKVYSVVRSWKDGSNGCRWCAGLSADEKNSLASKFPSVAKLWHPTKNGDLRPKDVTALSNKKVWWHCGKPKHEFEAMVCNMVAGASRTTKGCKFCNGSAAAPDNCLKKNFPSVAKLWHPSKNGVVTPADVTPGSSVVVIWLCERGHHWPAKVSMMVQAFRHGTATKGCPYCYGKKKWVGK